MTGQVKLEAAFKDVRKIFFPRWVRQKKWSVELNPDLPWPGRCEAGIKKIILKLIPEEEDELKLNLIHEICHSSRPNHSKKWIERMMNAAKKAQDIGETALSNKIWDEVEDYKGWAIHPEIYYADDIYARIGEMVRDAPNASYDSVIKSLAEELGHYQEDFEKMYTKCKQAYEEELNMIRERKRMRAKFENNYSIKIK